MSKWLLHYVLNLQFFTLIMLKMKATKLSFHFSGWKIGCYWFWN